MGDFVDRGFYSVGHLVQLQCLDFGATGGHWTELLLVLSGGNFLDLAGSKGLKFSEVHEGPA